MGQSNNLLYYRARCLGCKDVGTANAVDDRGRKYCSRLAFTVMESTEPIPACPVRVRATSPHKGRRAPSPKRKMTLRELVRHNRGLEHENRN